MTLPTIDLLSKTKRLSLTGAKETFTLTCEAIDADSATGYALYQGATAIQYSNTGEFALSVGKFSEGGRSVRPGLWKKRQCGGHPHQS